MRNYTSRKKWEGLETRELLVGRYSLRIIDIG